MISRLSAVLVSACAGLAIAAPAAAIEPDAVAGALAAALSGGTSAKVSFTGTAQQGADVVITGLSVTDGEKSTLTFAATTVENPTEDGDGIFASPRIAFADGTFSGESAGSIDAATLTGATILDPATVKSDAPARGVLFRTAEATGLKLLRNPGEVTIARVFMEVGNVVDNVPNDSKGVIDDITIPPEAFADGQFTPQTIGYEGLVIDVSWDGSRDQVAKTANIRDFTVGIQDGGDLSFSGIIGNLPAPSAMNDADASAKASDVELHTMTMRYDDKSLAGRVLDYFAKQQGITRQEYADGMVAAAGLFLGALNNPGFQGQVSTALGAFLKDPRSLTIKLQPEAPVSASEITGIAGTAPQTLPDRLKASVSANSAE